MTKDDEIMAMNFWGRVESFQAQKQVSLKAICQKNGIQYQTMLNQKSSAHLPPLKIACILAKELGCSVEWLVFGDTTGTSIENSSQLAQLLFTDKRLLSIANRLANMTQEELYSLEVLLSIRK